MDEQNYYNEISLNDLKSIGVTAVVLMDKRFPPSRRRLIYVRNSGTAGELITIQFGDNKTITSKYGVVLKNGETYCESTSDNFECWQGKVIVISDTATTNVSVMER